jgi:NAD(P)-dependent dehydrogenase (short-subunit alcohol dehydrogenase family)
MERLKGKNVLITGASSGIGQAIAIRFARDGANVAINYRSGAEQAEATQVLAKAARLNGAGARLSCRPTFRAKSRSRRWSRRRSRRSAVSTFS